MTYEIRTYSHEYLQKQVEIGSSILKNWLGAAQTPFDRLKAAYSKEGFDPSSKYYAFKDGEMVGFLTSGIDGKVAKMEFPIVLAEHKEAEDLLIENAFQKFKERGVEEVISRVSPRWGETVQFKDKYGYEKKEVLWISGRLLITDFDRHINTDEVLDVDMITDLPEIKTILINFREMKPDAVDRYFESLEKIKERHTSWKIIRRDGEIVGHDLLVQDKFNPLKARMNPIYAITEDAKEIRDMIMISHVKHAKDVGIEFIDNFWWDATESLAPDYLDYGFEIADVTSYSKKL